MEIRRWLEKSKNDYGATHMLVVCDTFDHDDYPVTVFKDEDARKVVDMYNAKSMQRVMECYHLGMDFDLQIAQKKAWNFDLPDIKAIEADPAHHPPTAQEMAEMLSPELSEFMIAQRTILEDFQNNRINISETLEALRIIQEQYGKDTTR